MWGIIYQRIKFVDKPYQDFKELCFNLGGEIAYNNDALNKRPQHNRDILVGSPII
jgi:hypothetical protein